jgi:hypothetical protein
MDWGRERQASLKPRALYTVYRRNVRRKATSNPIYWRYIEIRVIIMSFWVL